jgi:hypothetical protein
MKPLSLALRYSVGEDRSCKNRSVLDSVMQLLPVPPSENSKLVIHDKFKQQHEKQSRKTLQEFTLRHKFEDSLGLSTK